MRANRVTGARSTDISLASASSRVGETGELVDRGGVHRLAVEGHEADHQLVVALRVVPHDPCRGARLVAGEREHQGTPETVLHTLELRALEGPASQGVANHPQVDAGLLRLLPQLRHLHHLQAAILGRNDRMRGPRDFRDLFDHRFLLLQ